MVDAVKSRRRALIVWLIVSFGLLSVARAVALPEACDAVGNEQRESAISSAIGWIVDNQDADGRFLYRYDANTDTVASGYNWVRHAGTMLALAQARAAGFDVPDETFDNARRAIGNQLVTSGSAIGVRDGAYVSTGGTALLLLALTEVRPVTEIDLVRALGTHLLDAVEVGDDGVTRVLELADDDLNFVPSVVGRFTTGEVAFALARLERLWPDENWSDPLPGIVDYLVHHKAVEEGFVPDMPDHWAAYAFAESTLWDSAPQWSPDSIAWARKQMGLSSVMIRFEGQRTNSAPDVWLRGRTAVGAAVGTHGESMAGWVRFFASIDGSESSIVSSGRSRLACNNGTLIERQIRRSGDAPDRTAGSWMSSGVTQVDDQQHSLSALIAGDQLLVDSSDPRPSRRQPIDWSTSLVIVAMLLVASPARWSMHIAATPRASRRVLIGGAVFLGLLAAASASLLASIDVSVPTAAVAAGVVVVLGALASLVGVHKGERTFMSIARADVAMLVIAAGAADRSWPILIGLLLALVAAESMRGFADDVRNWVMRTTSVLAVAVGIALIVNGVYSI